MKLSHLCAVAAAAAAATGAAYLLVRGVGYDGVGIIFVAAAIIASWVGFYLAHRRARQLTTGVTAQIGGTIAATCLLAGLTLQAFRHAFTYPEIQLSISTVGSFIFPFVLRGSAIKAFSSLPTDTPK